MDEYLTDCRCPKIWILCNSSTLKLWKLKTVLKAKLQTGRKFDVIRTLQLQYVHRVMYTSVHTCVYLCGFSYLVEALTA